uniref:class I SAM-dependent methyltransferase n=1 Tax=Ningiella ruwaisensis TaxID=2364274 RepID=UPI0014484712|nr:methyltransferase domain-containing protein [Ningiella ruwaisensis]
MLEKSDFISAKRANKLADKCRDADVAVFEDKQSGVVYLDPQYGGRKTDYYVNKSMPATEHPRNDMDVADTERRSMLLESLIAGKAWLDFGCGPGYQLRHDSHLSRRHLGIELNQTNLELLKQSGYQVSADFYEAKTFTAQVVSLFHVMEHLDDPQTILKELAEASDEQATLIIEVPHANDWLIHEGPEAFKAFTFWSEHIVLHTRASLKYTIEASGWQVKYIKGVQRYPVWNHLHWCSHHEPSGLSGATNDATSIALAHAYESYLAARDQSDTLIAIATKRV